MPRVRLSKTLQLTQSKDPLTERSIHGRCWNFWDFVAKVPAWPHVKMLAKIHACFSQGRDNESLI